MAQCGDDGSPNALGGTGYERALSVQFKIEAHRSNLQTEIEWFDGSNLWGRRVQPARTHEKVRDIPLGKHEDYTPMRAARGVEDAVGMIEGRWKLEILFHLFGGNTLRFSDLERAIPAISQKMLIQQLRQLEQDGLVARVVHAQVPPKVEYSLTEWGQSLCPALDALLSWGAKCPVPKGARRGDTLSQRKRSDPL